MEIRRCIGCMEDMGEAEGNYCPHCGYDNSGNAPGHPCAMHSNTILHGRYLVGRMLGQGGFAITYIGFDLVLNVKVAVKEYFPMGAVAREGKSNTLRWNSVNNTEQRQGAYESFLREARKTAKIDQIPSIVRVRDTFYENETAYIVMDYVGGVTLKEKLKREGIMTFSACVELLTPMMEGLAKVHETGLIHRDISPDNIMVQPNGSVKLLDLGAAKDMSVNQGPQSQIVAKNGFSPLEQYTQAGQIGSWTDIYALCATIYYCITGRLLPSALDRMNSPELNFSLPTGKSLPASAEAVLKAGLEVDSRNRTRDVTELLSRLNGAMPKKKGDKAPEKKKWLIPAVGGIAALLLLAGGIGLYARFSESRQTDAEAEGRSREEETEESSYESEWEMNPELNLDLDPDLNPEQILCVEKLGTSNANILNYGGYAVIPDEYEYYIGGDNALYLCALNVEDNVFYLGDAEQVCDFGAYITLGQDNSVYFLTTDYTTNSVCRMDKDGGNLQALCSTADGRGYQYLQYALLSDGREYLYYGIEKEADGSVLDLYRYDLENHSEELLIEGEIWWYNLCGDSVYYTELANEENALTRLKKADLEGQNIQELDSGKDFLSGFAEEGKLYLWSLKEEALLVYNPDGTQDENVGGFYNIELDTNCNYSYMDGWIIYTSLSDGEIHRIRANGTGDTVLLEGHSAIQMCYVNQWLWFIESKPAEKEHQVTYQVYLAYKDGSKVLDIREPEIDWGLQSAHNPDFQYEESEDGSGVVITGYTGPMTSFEIPDTLGGRPVVGIGDGAFKESSIREIAFPEGVRLIGEEAFNTCENLVFAGLPESLEEIGRRAFSCCGELTGIDFPEGLKDIGTLAFAETRISKVHIPAGLTHVGSGAFGVWADAGLTEFTVAPGNTSYEVKDGALYTYGGEILEAFPSGGESFYAIPEGTAAIEYYAFLHCSGMTQVQIPESVLQIGDNAFFDTGLTEITISSDCELKGELGGDITVNYK